MNVAVFDTHAFVKRLTAVGMPEAQAEALADEQMRLIDERLATKSDLHALGEQITAVKTDLRADIARLEAATKADIAKLEAATKVEIAKSEAAMKAEIAKSEAAMKAEIAKSEAATKAEIAKSETAMKADIARLEAAMKADGALIRHELTIRLGAMIMALGGVLIAIKFLGH